MNKLLLACALLTGCTELDKARIAGVGCSRTWELAVLREFPPAPSREELESIRQFAETLDDRCIKQSYLMWAAIYQNQLEEREAVEAALPHIPVPPHKN